MEGRRDGKTEEPYFKQHYGNSHKEKLFSCSEKSLSAAKKAEELSPRTFTIFTIFKPLIYDGLSIGSIYYQGFTQAFLMMPVLWKKIEFYQEESNPEVIVIAAGALGWGWVGVLRPSLSRHVFPLWEHFLPTKFSPHHKSLSFPY